MRFLIRPAVAVGVALLCVVLAAGAFYAYLSLNARRIFNAQVSALTQRPVTAGVVQAEFPAGLLVKDLSIDGLFTCSRVRAALNIPSLFSRSIHIDTLELLSPVLTWDTAMKTEGFSAVPSSPAVPVPVRNVILSRIVVNDGVLKIVSRDEAGAEREHVIEGVQIRARNVPLTDTPARTEFFLTGLLLRMDVPFIGNFIKAGGWFNWAAKDMDAALQVIDDNGRVGVDAKLASRQNALTVFGNMTLTGEQEPQAAGHKTGMIETAVLGTMAATQTDVEAGFSFKTKMDRPEIGTVNLSGYITTGLNSSVTSGNIVAGLKAVGEELFKTPEAPGVQK